MIRHFVASVLVLLGLFAAHAEAYGPRGHALVGSIADSRLEKKPVADKIAKLLDGMSLAKAALLPDQIKEWDGMDDPSKNPDTLHLPNHKMIEKDLLAFFLANPVTDHIKPDHHTLHYTDVPIAPATDKVTYASGKVGRNEFDVVQMIPFCVKVLKGTVPEDNPKKITKRIAVILLAHLVGDIHQPLHVGAQYFDVDGKAFNPDAAPGTPFADQGGNTLMLVLRRPGDHGHPGASFKLHSYWDGQVVTTAIAILQKEIRSTTAGVSQNPISDDEIAKWLAAKEPANWDLVEPNVSKLAIAWADEILPVAREAHDRLEYKHIKIDKVHRAARGQAVEREEQPGGVAYPDWAGQVTRGQVHKAGWRLAALLESALD